MTGCESQSMNNETISGTASAAENHQKAGAVNFILKNVVNDKINPLNYYYHDSLYEGHQLDLNNGTTALFIYRPIVVCRANKSQDLLLVYPGEKIIILNEGNENISYHIDGNALRSSELMFFPNLIKRYGQLYNFIRSANYHSKVNDLVTFKKNEKIISDLKISRMAFLDSFIKYHSPSSHFVNKAKNIIESSALKDSLMLYWYNREKLKQGNIYSKYLNDKLSDEKRVAFDDNLVCQNALATILSMLTTEYLTYQIQNFSDFEKAFNFAEKNFSGISKDFLISYAINSLLLNNLNLPEKYRNEFLSICKDSSLKKQVEKNLNFGKNIKKLNGIDELNNYSSDGTLTFDNFLKKEKGELLLLDFWASWCAPCIEELPHSKLISDKYSSSLKIIYISMDTDSIAWRRSVKNNASLVNINNSYLLLGNFNSSFAKQNSISSIPRYMLVNKKGQIINADAPRPSDPKLIPLLDALLKKELMKIITEYVDKLGVRYNHRKLRNFLFVHPNHPSLLTLSDLLDELKVENSAVRISEKNFNQVPVPFKALVRGFITNKPYWALIAALF